MLSLGSEARTALEEANIPETLHLWPVLQMFKLMIGMQPDGSFDDDVAPQFLKNIINTADITGSTACLQSLMQLLTRKSVTSIRR